MRTIALLLLLTTALAPALAQTPPRPQPARPADPASLTREAIRRAEAGELGAAQQRLPPASDPVLQSFLSWTAYRTPRGGDSFGEVASFVERHSQWPLMQSVRRRAEELARGEADTDRLLTWFASFPPVSRDGKVRLAEALTAVGRADEATAVIRQAYIEESLGAHEETEFLERFGAQIRAADHDARLDRLLWAGTWEAAQRTLPRASPDRQVVGRARLALNGQGDATGAVDAVPQRLRSDPGLMFDLARWHGRGERNDKAREILLAAPVEQVRAATWWTIRDLQARRALAEGNSDLAYRLAATHGLPAGTGEWADAEFLAGWLSLRFQNNPERALTHFQTLFQGVRLPISTARGAYWAGRALDQLNRGAEAEAWYRRASEQSTVFYGQLAAVRLSLPIQLPPTPPRDAGAIAAIERGDFGRLVQLLRRFGEAAAIDPFVLRQADLAATPESRAATAAWAVSLARADLSSTIARRALREGQVLIDAGWPVLAEVAAEGAPEAPLALAIIRQESNFMAAAVSRAGARGLMQLMPATARQTATRAGEAYTEPRLTSDPAYNVRLGRFFLAGLIDQYGGHYPLAIAAYNAGPGRVRQWQQTRMGDPRDPSVDLLDWIEQIPFNETRNYVHRVLENLVIYRVRLGTTITPGDRTAAWCLAGCAPG